MKLDNKEGQEKVRLGLLSFLFDLFTHFILDKSKSRCATKLTRVLYAPVFCPVTGSHYGKIIDLSARTDRQQTSNIQQSFKSRQEIRRGDYYLFCVNEIYLILCLDNVFFQGYLIALTSPDWLQSGKCKRNNSKKNVGIFVYSCLCHVFFI